MSADDGSSWSDIVTSPGPTPSQPKRGLAATKEQWESEEASEDVLNNLLRVKKLSQRVSSVESDGMPSMVDVDDNISILSESSDLQRARKMYADLQAMSMESTGSQEVYIVENLNFLKTKISLIRMCKILMLMQRSFTMKSEL